MADSGFSQMIEALFTHTRDPCSSTCTTYLYLQAIMYNILIYLQAILYFAADQIKDKLGYLRGYYSKELGKCNISKTSGSGADDIYVSPWKYFKKFDVFLRSVIIPRGSKSNMVSNIHVLPVTRNL